MDEVMGLDPLFITDFPQSPLYGGPVLDLHLSQTLFPPTMKRFSVFLPHIWHLGTPPPPNNFKIAEPLN